MRTFPSAPKWLLVQTFLLIIVDNIRKSRPECDLVLDCYVKFVSCDIVSIWCCQHQNETTSPPIGGARQNSTPLNFTISADDQSNSVCHYWWSCLEPWPNYAPICRPHGPHPFYTLLYSTWLHFATDRKQLVTSYMVCICKAGCSR